MYTKDTLSLLLSLERTTVMMNFKCIQECIRGTHKNLDVIVLHLEMDETKDIQAKVELKLDTLVFHEPSSNFLKELTDLQRW